MPHFNIDSHDVVHKKDIAVENLSPVPIPHNSMAGPTIFPSRVLYGYNQPATSQISFPALMISKALSTPQATAVYWCLANNSGSTGGRYWFGYLFIGGPVCASDFVAGPPEAHVESAQAFNVTHNSGIHHPVTHNA